MIELSIVIVSWNVASLLEACLDSIFSSEITIVGLQDETQDSGKIRVEIIVVDSGSTDSTSTLSSKYPEVRWLHQQTNIGFSRGCNIGLRVARGTKIFLLNPDTRVELGSLSILVNYLDECPNIAAVGPKTLFPDGQIQKTRRRFPTILTSLFVIKKTSNHQSIPKWIDDYYYYSNYSPNSVHDVDWVQGSALMIRSEVVEQVGLLDETFWMYYEEVDWCKRVKDFGWRIAYVGTSTIIHFGGESTKQLGDAGYQLWKQSKLRYFSKHHSKLAVLSIRFLFFFYEKFPAVINLIQIGASIVVSVWQNLEAV